MTTLTFSSAPATVMTLATEKQLTVSELRTILKERGVSATGTKKELQERLRANNQLFVVQDLNNNLNEMLSNKNNEIVELHARAVAPHNPHTLPFPKPP